jgi:hypothetical protein
VDIPGVENVTSITTASTQSGQSTTPLIASHSSIGFGSAAHFCRELQYGGYSDWFLPAKSELAYLYCKANVNNHSLTSPEESPDCVGFGGKTFELQGFTNWYYWSSTEGSSGVAAVGQNFNGGGQGVNWSKSNSFHVRCLRAIRELDVRHRITGLAVVGPLSTSDWFLVHVRNTTSTQTGILTTSVSGPFEIKVATNSCAGLSLAPGASCTLEIRADVPWDGPFSGSLTVSSGTLTTTSSLWGTATGIGDPCANLSNSPRPPIGSKCYNGAIYAGEIAGKQYLVTPGGCTDSTTPTCEGTDSVTKQWATGTGVNHGGTSVSDGEANTLAQASQPAVVASKFCGNMTYAELSGWFLPARDELVHLYNNQSAIGGFSGNVYWSSTQTSTNGASTVNLATGAISSVTKTTSYRIRCMKRVSP